MADKTITLKLQGGVTLESLSYALTHFSKLIAALSMDARAKGMPWDIASLEAGSATITARASTAHGYTEQQADLVVKSYRQVGRELSEHRDLSGFRVRVRRPAKALASLATWGAEEVVFETAEDDHVIQAPQPAEEEKAQASTVPFPTRSLGSVTGRVQSMSNRGELRFTIYESISDRAVSCYVDPDQEDTMLDVWGKLATVEGEVSRDPRNGRPIAVRHIERIVTHEECDDDAYKRSRGAVVPLPGAELPEVVIRRLREAQ